MNDLTLKTVFWIIINFSVSLSDLFWNQMEF